MCTSIDVSWGLGGDAQLTMPHMFYANDAIFFGEWDKENVHVLIRASSDLLLSVGHGA